MNLLFDLRLPFVSSVASVSTDLNRSYGYGIAPFWDSYHLQEVCFHNCIFRNCEFTEINSYKSKKLTTVPELTQGFSACEIYNCLFKRCCLENIFFSIGRLIHTSFDNMLFFKCIFHRICFNNVEFIGKTILNQTSIFSPSRNFNIAFRITMEDFSIDSRCKITAFSFHDIVNFSNIR